MDKNKLNMKLEKLKSSIDGKYSKSNMMNVVRVYKRILEFEDKLNKAIEDFSKQDLYDVIFSFNSKSYSTNLVYVRSINIILEELSIETTLSVRDDNVDIRKESDKNVKEVIKKEKEYFTEDEVKNICSILNNPCDKFLVYALFKGIDFDDILELKTESIDLKKKKIYVLGKTIVMDETMFDICSDLLRTTEYIKRQTITGTDYYEFNMSSPYAIKVRPLKTNSNGLTAMKKSTAKIKLVRLSELLSTEEQVISMTSVGLKRSGLYSEINKKVTDESDEEIRNMIKEYAYMNNIKTNEQEIWNIYSVLYRSNNVSNSNEF